MQCKTRSVYAEGPKECRCSSLRVLDVGGEEHVLEAGKKTILGAAYLAATLKRHKVECAVLDLEIIFLHCRLPDRF